MTPTEILLQAETTKRRVNRMLGSGPHRPPATVKQILERARRLGFGPRGPQARQPKRPVGGKSSAPSLLYARKLPYIVEGLCVPTGKPAHLTGGDENEILSFGRAAFADAPDGDDCVLVVDHYWNGDSNAPDEVVGRQRDGSLFLWNDAAGLHYRCRLPATTLGNIVLNKLLAGECMGCSGSFRFQGSRDYGAGRVVIAKSKVREISLLFTKQPAFAGTMPKLVCCSPDLSVFDPDFEGKARAALLSLTPGRG